MIGVVVPSNRPDRLAAWEAAWAPRLGEARLYVVRDEPATWAEIARRLGEDAWIIPRRTDAIRSWGLLQAAWDGCTEILTLDDDCLPAGQAVAELVAPLARRWMPGHADGTSPWLSTLHGLPPRGLPEAYIARTAAHMGYWSGVPDLDGLTQLAHPGPAWPEVTFAPAGRVPRGRLFPCCGMHVAFTAEALPAAWFGLMGDHLTEPRAWGVHRAGDIWMGLMLKTVADALGWAVSIGGTWVHHSRASDPLRNFAQESVAREIHEWLWTRFQPLALTATTWADAVLEAAQTIVLPETDYWRAWRRGYAIWVRLLEEPLP